MTTTASASNSANKRGTELVNRALAEYPKLPSRQLARMLRKDHPLVFSNEDHARTMIRYRRGALGSTARGQRGLPAPITPRIELPKSDEREFLPFVVDGCKRVLVLSDIHIPYHTTSALEIAIAEGKRRDADCVLLNGDTLDFHALSRFERNPEARDFKGERALCVQFLSYLRQEFPKARILFKEGNHDERLRSYVLAKAPEIYDTSILGLPALLHFDRYHVEHIADKRAVMLGGLPVLHGHELAKGFFAPASPARTAYLKTGVSVMVSHHHITTENTKTILGGKIVTSWSTGCLSDLCPPYNPYSGYNHGFASVEIEGQDFDVTNHRIHQGRLLN